MIQASSVASAGSHKKHVLVIEDNPPDALLAKMVHDELRHCSTLAVVENGKAALRYLENADEYADAPHPDLIMLDLKMPGSSGLDVLAQIRRSPQGELLPVIICSGSFDPSEIHKAYELGANAVIRKPVDLKEFFRVIGACYEFWCTAAVLPHMESAQPG